jgi:peptidoglycan/xylan/chitin deacetylase (PgdA/CDA1 family)
MGREKRSKFANDAKTTADLASSLAQSGKKLDGKLRDIRANGQKRCIVSFLSDDGWSEDYTVLKPIFEPHGIPISLAVVPGWRNQVGQLSDAQLDELYGMGWEFASHTYNHPHLPELSEEEQDYELRASKEWLEAKGYKCDYIVYPFGEHNEITRKVAKKYYRFGVQTGGAIVDYPLKTYAINRVSVGVFFDGVGKDTLDYYKSKFDEAYAKKQWVIFMLHPRPTEASQLPLISALIDYIKTFPEVPFMTVGDAYDQMGNMLAVGDGTTEKFVITNTGEIINNVPVTPLYSAELANTSEVFVTGTGAGQTTPVNFVDNSPLKINLVAASAMTNPSIISVGKNIWGGLKATNDVLKSVNNTSYTRYEVVDGRRCIVLTGNTAMMKVFFSTFIPGKQYVLSFEYKKPSGSSTGALKFKYSDGTEQRSTTAITSVWTKYAFGTTSGKTVETLEGHYGTGGEVTYIDIDTLQLELGNANTTVEKYKESRLDITASIAIGDVLRFENDKLYKNAEEVTFKNTLRAYKNGSIYVSDGSSPTINIIYSLNEKAADYMYKGIS